MVSKWLIHLEVICSSFIPGQALVLSVRNLFPSPRARTAVLEPNDRTQRTQWSQRPLHLLLMRAIRALGAERPGRSHGSECWEFPVSFGPLIPVPLWGQNASCQPCLNRRGGGRGPVCEHTASPPISFLNSSKLLSYSVLSMCEWHNSWSQFEFCFLILC